MIEVSWQNKSEGIVLWQFRGQWTEAEFYSALSEHWTISMPIHETVRLIVDFREGCGPKNLVQLAIAGFRNPHQNATHAVIVGSITTWKSIYYIVTHLMGRPAIDLQFAESIEDAEALLRGSAMAKQADGTRSGTRGGYRG